MGADVTGERHGVQKWIQMGRPLGFGQRHQSSEGRTAAGAAGWPVGGEQVLPLCSHTDQLEMDHSPKSGLKESKACRRKRRRCSQPCPGPRKRERKKWQSALEICAQLWMPGEGGRAAADREGRVRYINLTELACGA